MLKTMSTHKLIVPVIVLLLGIGIVLTGVGFAMEGNTDYLKEDGHHRWYQIIYLDQNDHLRISVNFDNQFSIVNLNMSTALETSYSPD